MKKIQLILKPTSIFLCISILATETLFSQTVTISGSSAVSTGAQYYYQANFDYQLAPYTTISWSIGGGTIISQSINPTSTVYCVIEWTDDHSTGTITLDEEFDGGYAARTVDIGLPLIGGGTMNFYNQYETQQYWNII